MRYLWITLLCTLCACTTYDVKRYNPETGEVLEVKVRSMREFEQPQLHYERSKDTAAFDFGAASATNADPLSAIGSEVIKKILEGYFPQPQ